MDDINLFAENEKESEILIQAVRIYSYDIGMKFGIEKMCHANNEKQDMTHDGQNGITNSRKNRTLGEKETYKYSGILEADNHQTRGDVRKKRRVSWENEKATRNQTM